MGSSLVLLLAIGKYFSQSRMRIGDTFRAADRKALGRESGSANRITLADIRFAK